MAYSYIDYGVVGDLTAAEISGVFAPTGLNYVSPSNIYVTVTTTASSVVTSLTTSQFTVVTTPTLGVTVLKAAEGGIDLVIDDFVRIGRSTPVDALARTYQDGSVLKASDMNTQNNQFLYTIQEALDTGTGALPINLDGHYNAGGRRIKKLGTPVNDTDACTLAVATQILTYGAAVEPQAWSFTTSALDLASNGVLADADRIFSLEAPDPNAAVDNMYLVEVSGIMQAPGSDYTVTAVGNNYTLRLIGAGTAGASQVANGEPLAVRNFGNSRNVIALPYTASEATSATSHSVTILGLASQQGDLINATDDLSNELFRVGPTGEVIVGAGDAPSPTRSSMSTTEIQVGEIDTTSSSTPDAYGVKLSTSSSSGLIEVEGASPASSAEAIHVHDWKFDGSHEVPFKVTYGGAITALGAADVQGLTTTTLTTTGAATIGENITVASGKKIDFGVLELSDEGLAHCGKVGLNTYYASLDGERGVNSNVSPGTIGHFPHSGNDAGPFMAFGGTGGAGYNYGGAGSALFTYNSGSRYGPQLRTTSHSVQVRGSKVPTAQGGQTGQDGTTPATLHIIDGENISWSSVADDEVVTRKQIDTQIAPRPIAVFQCQDYVGQNNNNNYAPLLWYSPQYSRNTTVGDWSWAKSNGYAYNVDASGNVLIGGSSYPSGGNPQAGTTANYGSTIFLRDNPDPTNHYGEYCWKLTTRCKVSHQLGGSTTFGMRWERYNSGTSQWATSSLFDSRVKKWYHTNSSNDTTQVIETTTLVDMTGYNEEQIRLVAGGGSSSNHWTISEFEITIEVL